MFGVLEALAGDLLGATRTRIRRCSRLKAACECWPRSSRGGERAASRYHPFDVRGGHESVGARVEVQLATPAREPIARVRVVCERVARRVRHEAEAHRRERQTEPVVCLEPGAPFCLYRYNTVQLYDINVNTDILVSPDLILYFRIVCY